MIKYTRHRDLWSKPSRSMWGNYQLSISFGDSGLSILAGVFFTWLFDQNQPIMFWCKNRVQTAAPQCNSWSVALYQHVSLGYPCFMEELLNVLNLCQNLMFEFDDTHYVRVGIGHETFHHKHPSFPTTINVSVCALMTGTITFIVLVIDPWIQGALG